MLSVYLAGLAESQMLRCCFSTSSCSSSGDYEQESSNPRLSPDPGDAKPDDTCLGEDSAPRRCQKAKLIRGLLYLQPILLLLRTVCLQTPSTPLPYESRYNQPTSQDFHLAVPPWDEGGTTRSDVHLHHGCPKLAK